MTEGETQWPGTTVPEPLNSNVHSLITHPGSGTRGRRVLFYSESGSVGKSVVSSLVFAATGGLVLSVHSRGDGTGAYMVPSVKVGTPEIPRLFEVIGQQSGNVFVDVSVLSASAFQRHVEVTGLLPGAFDAVVIPTTPDWHGQQAAISTMKWCRDLGVDPAHVRLVLNRADRLKPARPQFAAVFDFVEINREFENVSPDCVLPESSIVEFCYRRHSIGSLLYSTVDYKAQLQAAWGRGATGHALDELAALHVNQRIAHGLKPYVDRLIGSLTLAPRP
ncbi:hypothetical protein [Paraburkholderia elongata]|uniref:Uncharacterized protein n=1 Tax=Paraburkholderia elongata TaxID=2675747 RepID=A0A972SSX0_9BURK|nr:hypothetical protein [Paraburkholderia elongata]NPT62340.1 hypothetical protein [Paraburkholderia elongata]